MAEERTIYVCPNCDHVEGTELWDERDLDEKGPPACPVDGCYESSMRPLRVLPTSYAQELERLIERALAVPNASDPNSVVREVRTILYEASRLHPDKEQA